jgi:hypothetical protein
MIETQSMEKGSSDNNTVRSETVSGASRLEQWRRGGKLHRDDGPAHIEIREDGGQSLGWYRDGQLYRVDGPAWIDIHADGTRSERWYVDDQPHRADGPACLIVRPDGSRVEEWWIAGHQIKDRSFVPPHAKSDNRSRL